jgi:hypothetical protein
MSAYTANLASFLVSRNMVEYSVSTLEDALKQGTPVCIQRFSVMDDIVSKKYPEMNIVRKETEQGIFDGLRNEWYGGKEGCGVALTNLGTFQLYQGRQAVNPDCALTTEKRVVRQLPSGFATAVDTGGTWSGCTWQCQILGSFPMVRPRSFMYRVSPASVYLCTYRVVLCTSLVSFVLNLHLTEMAASGFIEEAWQTHLDKVNTINCADRASQGQGGASDEENFSLGMKEMAGIFVVHASMSLVALLWGLGQKL